MSDEKELGKRLDDYDFDLPEELIAQHPLERRDSSRLMLVDKKGSEPKDYVFHDILELLTPNDFLVMNNSKVIPARIYGHRKDKDERVEFLLLKETDKDIWQALVKPGKKAKIGSKFSFDDELFLEVIDIMDDGVRLVKLSYEGLLIEVLERIGTMPLPPYIHEKLEDQSRYQTVYANIPGSAAAPTAGLHFTNELIAELEKKGVEHEYIELKVGLGTFKPVSEENIEDHHMHSEWYSISENAANRINNAKAAGKNIVAVGTTSIRTLESATDDNGVLHAGSSNTNIFIFPGYNFKMVDSLITNFHLPKSTLIMLISAFMGRENALNAYKKAVERRYRFFSFGDAMFIR